MYPISDVLKVRNNLLNSYLPVRKKGNEFDWDIVSGLVFSHALKKQLKNYGFDEFSVDCKLRITKLLDQSDFWHVLDRMYFQDRDICKISPLFLLFKNEDQGSNKSQNVRLGTLFASLLEGFSLTAPVADKLNFIETELLNQFNERLCEENASGFDSEQPYLPYLAEAFQKDMKFLSQHPQYMLQEFEATLKFYAFTYCAQLALHINGWKSGIPQSKPLYFILDTERASVERTHVQKYGYKLLSKFNSQLFPILSALEVLQRKDRKRPLWQVYIDCIEYPNQGKLLSDFHQYISAFLKHREMDREIAEFENIEQAFEQLILLASEQFQELKGRATVNKLYVEQLERKISGDFIKSRGRAGRVLTLNQNYLQLLTNLSIGNSEKLRLHELLQEFKLRGIYLDNQSSQALVNFYERIGNLERMSDSGDAVYVLKTV